MPSSDFKPEELVTEGYGPTIRVFPKVGGRLRLGHAEDLVGIETIIVHFEPRKNAWVKATARTKRGTFEAHGYADDMRDKRARKDLTDALLELAETRAVARALRLSGWGLEFTGAEEVSHVVGQAVEDDPKASSTRRVQPDSTGRLETVL